MIFCHQVTKAVCFHWIQELFSVSNFMGEVKDSDVLLGVISSDKYANFFTSVKYCSAFRDLVCKKRISSCLFPSLSPLRINAESIFCWAIFFCAQIKLADKPHCYWDLFYGLFLFEFFVQLLYHQTHLEWQFLWERFGLESLRSEYYNPGWLGLGSLSSFHWADPQQRLDHSSTWTSF